MIDPLSYFVLFVKASLLSPNGLSNIASLHHDLIGKGWATEQDFNHSLAIGQLSPGPGGLWVVGLGYLTYGWLGALLALLAITLPPLLVLVVAGFYHRFGQRDWITPAMRGISMGVVGIQLSISWTILLYSGSNWRGWLIGGGASVLALNKRVNVLVILALAGLAGYLALR